MIGFEPTTLCTQNRCATPAPHPALYSTISVNYTCPIYIIASKKQGKKHSTYESYVKNVLLLQEHVIHADK